MPDRRGREGAPMFDGGLNRILAGGPCNDLMA